MSQSYQTPKQRVPAGTAMLVYKSADAFHPKLRELLLIKRIGAHGAGKVSVPGGWVDPGEDPMDAAIRETWEEVGLKVTNAKFLDYTYDRHCEGIEDVCLWFEAIEWSGHPRPTNPDRIESVWWERLRDLAGRPAHELFLPFDNMIKKGIIEL